MGFSLLVDGSTHDLPGNAASISDSGAAWIDEAAFRDALGWELKSEGLCRGNVCVPVRDRGALAADGRIDLGAFASLVGRPAVIDAAEGVAALGVAAADQSAAMATLEAPDFELPDLAGRTHRLSEHRGKKVLLIAYASW